MNHLLFTVVVAWHTKNWRHVRDAERWCKDYSLAPIHKNLYIGTIYRNERAELDKKLHNLFIGKNERYCSFVLCRSCSKDVIINFDIGNPPWKQLNYELIQGEPPENA